MNYDQENERGECRDGTALSAASPRRITASGLYASIAFAALVLCTTSCGPEDTYDIWEADYCGWVVVSKNSGGFMTIEKTKEKTRKFVSVTDVTFAKYELNDTICAPN